MRVTPAWLGSDPTARSTFEIEGLYSNRADGNDHLATPKHRRGFQPYDSGVFYGHSLRHFGQSPKISSASEIMKSPHVQMGDAVNVP